MGPEWILGGGGTVGCRLAEINKGWGQFLTKATNGTWIYYASKSIENLAAPAPITATVAMGRRPINAKSVDIK